LFGVAKHGAGLCGEQFCELHGRAVEATRGAGIEVEPRPSTAINELDGGVRSHAELDRSRRVARELSASGRHVVDKDKAPISDRRVTGTLAQLVLKGVGLLGQGVREGLGVQRVVQLVDGDADEVNPGDVSCGRNREGAERCSAG